MALTMVFKGDLHVDIPAVVSEDVSFETAQVDHYIDLHQKAEAFEMKAHMKLMDEARKQLQDIANKQFSDNDTAILEGTLGKVVLSPRSTVQEILNPQDLLDDLISKFGEAAAFATLKFSIASLKGLLSEAEIAKYAEKKQVGSRSLKSVVEK